MSRKSFIHNTRRQHAQSLAILAGLAAGALGLVAPTLQAANLAADNASNYVPGGTMPYSFQQVNGSGSGPVVNTSEPNEGYGFGPWTIIDNTAPGVAMDVAMSQSSYGSIVASTVGTTANSPNSVGQFAIGGYGSNTAQASQIDVYRAFTGGALGVGQQFSVAMGGYNDGTFSSVVPSGSYNDGYPEVGLRMETAAPVLSAGTAGGFGAPSINDASSAVQIAFNNLASSGTYFQQIVITDASGTHAIPLGSTILPTALTLNFMVTSATTYTLTASSPFAGNLNPPETDPVFKYSGTYTGNIIGANIFNENPNNFYFNNLAVTTAPLTFDASGANPTAPTDGSGTWNTTSAVWSNGATDSVWSNTSDAPVIFGADNGTAGTVTLGSNIVVSGLTFNPVTSGNYTIAASGSNTLEVTGSTVYVNANATIAANTTFENGLTLDNAGSSASHDNLTLTGTDTVNGTISLNGWNSYLTVGPGGTLTANGLNLTQSGGGNVLQLFNTNPGNKVIINYGSNPSPNSLIQSYVATGVAYLASDGSYQSNGSIIAPTGYAVGYANGSDGVVNGLSAGQEEIMATLPGDATLQGTVNLTDFGILRTNFGMSSGANWDQGDFNADGAVNLTDFGLLRSNFGKSLTAPATVSAGTAQTSNSSLSQMTASTVLPASDVKIVVNTTTGDVQLDTTVSGGLPIAGYQIQSASSSLVGANLHSINSVDSSFFVFISTNSNISEGSFGTYTLNPSFDLGNIFNVTGTHDLTFEWLDANSNSYSGAPVIYTAVPEPATIGLFLMAGMGGLLLIRRRKAVWRR